MFVQLDFFNIISVLKTKKIDKIYNKFMVIFFLGIMMDVLMGVHVPSIMCPWNLPHLKGWSLKQMGLHMIFIMNMVEMLVLVLEKSI